MTRVQDKVTIVTGGASGLGSAIARCLVLFSLYILSLSLFHSEGVLAEEPYSPYANQDYPVSVYWGDTHVHSNLSYDSYPNGNKKLTPESAYKLARGEEITANNGMKVRLRRPLDFLVVADHAANMGLMQSIDNANPALLNTKSGRRLYKQFHSNNDYAKNFMWNNAKENMVQERTYAETIWKRTVGSPDKYNDPGKFTAFSGFEWSSFGYCSSMQNAMSDAYDAGRNVYNLMGNLHRIVIFKDDHQKVTQVIPFSRLDSENPEDLWNFMQNYEAMTGDDVIAIPHNGNTSKGEMFSVLDYDGRPISKGYAKTRSRWEPLYEVTQMKGDGEAHPALSPTDEFADYETWNSWNGRSTKGIETNGWIDRKKSEYARSTLKLGLDQQVRLKINPFKFGMIGSTDSHTPLSTAGEDNFWGKLSQFEPSPTRMLETLTGDSLHWEIAASGYAAICSEENTREALFAAMKRKETYASSTGPRMTVRFFGGWDYSVEDELKPDLARIGYAKGVPMGGDLTNAPKDSAPSFLIRTVKDPEGANLDRVQVIKGWRSMDGELHEKIYNVALSDGRKENKDGKAPPVGSTVNIKDASYTNSIGDPELAVVWQDPDFDKNELAFYYVRVLEIPTPRWTAYDAKFFKLKDLPETIPMVTQERAYTSPIWYSPPAKAGGE